MRFGRTIRIWAVTSWTAWGTVYAPACVGERLNQRFPLDRETSQFFTILYGILNTETKVFRYFSAGHPPMIHVPCGGGPTVLPIAAFPVGVVDKPEHEDQKVQLRSGDRFGSWLAGKALQDDVSLLALEVE